MAVVRRGPTACRHEPGCPHDIGPAAARATTFANALAAADLVTGAQPSGSGPVERTYTTQQPREGDMAKGTHRMSPEGLAAIRAANARRWGKAVEAAVAEDPTVFRCGSCDDARPHRHEPAPVEFARFAVEVVEEPTAVPATPAQTLAALGPWQSAAPIRVRMGDRAAESAIPCSSCLHEPVCGLKSAIPADPETPHTVELLAPGLRMVFTDARVECDHLLRATS
jgi:hypothetical protein